MQYMSESGTSYEQIMSAIRQVLQEKIDEMGRGGQVTLAARAAVSGPFLSQLMSGKRQGTLKMWMSVIEAAGYTLPEFVIQIGEIYIPKKTNELRVSVYERLKKLPESEILLEKLLHIFKHSTAGQWALFKVFLDGCYAITMDKSNKNSEL
ncbi:MAG: hypothetical protein LBJ14_07365 [Desulfarculales bacterium]|jgi:hypothetical protein|nr:hypothetical protein [Desulfarculales bacterium]